MKIILMAVIGALAAILANKGVAVFNDGLRPILPELLEGRMDRKGLATISFAMSFGLVIGYGIPISLAAPIILIHSVLLATDIIGTWAPNGKKGLVLAGLAGALWSVGIVIGLDFLVQLFQMLPVNFLPSMGLVGTPIVAAFCVFPALTVAYQDGLKKGALVLAITVLVRQLVQYHGQVGLASFEISLNPEGMALLAGMVVMLWFASREKPDPQSTSVDLVSIFAERVRRIHKNIVILAVMGGLVAAATSLVILAGDPISLHLLARQEFTEAALTAFARGIGFIPLVATTAIATGVYSPIGMTFIFVIGILLAGNPLAAFVLGALCIAAEVGLLTFLARFLDRFPGMRKCADNIRTVMTQILDVALLVGGMLAANDIAPGLGFLIIIGLCVFNKTSKHPLVTMVVGPVGAIFVGILVNLLAAVGLYLPAVVK